MTKMTDKVALVIGGASGIGEAIAGRLAAEGASVFLTGRRKAEVDGAAARIGHGANAIMADASDPADIERAVGAVIAEHGRIDALVLNAAVSEPADIMSSTPELFDGTVARLGVRRLPRSADRCHWLAGTSVQSRNRACHYRRRTEPGAAGRPRVATSASAVTCSSGGSPGSWPSLR